MQRFFIAFPLNLFRFFPASSVDEGVLKPTEITPQDIFKSTKHERTTLPSPRLVVVCDDISHHVYCFNFLRPQVVLAVVESGDRGKL